MPIRRMLCVAIHIHRNILSSQCYIRYADDSNSVDTIQVKCFPSELELLLLMNDKIIKKVQISSPNDFFIPSSLSSYSDFSMNSDSTVVCRTTLTPAGQRVAECSFRLKISGVDKLDQSESELGFDVKDYFKEWFRNRNQWYLFCASCGVRLPVKPVLIESVREYCDSELSEGWFCHGNDPQPILQPSSHILYLDDISFYLYPILNSDISYLKSGHINDLSTDCSHVSCSVSSGINDSNKSLPNCCDSENNNQCINQKRPDVKNKTDLNAQVLISSIDQNVNSSNLKQANFAVNVCSHCACADCKYSTNECLNDSKALYSVIKCQSCGDVLTSEKSPVPFIRFYFDKLMFKNPCLKNDDPLEYAHQITLLSFWSLVKRSWSSLLPSKLFLQTKICNEERCLLLWIPSTPIAQFLLQDSLEYIPLDTSLKTEPVYKILYFVGTSGSENVRAWRHDFSVDYYRVSDTMVRTVTEILEASSNCLPKTSEAGNFSCGFMRAPSHMLQ